MNISLKLLKLNKTHSQCYSLHFLIMRLGRILNELRVKKHSVSDKNLFFSWGALEILNKGYFEKWLYKNLLNEQIQNV